MIMLFGPAGTQSAVAVAKQPTTQIEAMADAEVTAIGTPAYSEYGLQVAQTLIAAVSMLPEADRKQALKLAMDRIDPTFHARAEQAMQHELQAGVNPMMALEHGIAFAASSGLVSTLISLGKKQQLGAVQEQQICVRPNFTWVAETPDLPGHYERLRAGQSPTSGVPGFTVGGVCSAIEVRVPPKQTAPVIAPMMAVGPWLLPMSSDKGDVGFISLNESKMTQEQRQVLGEGLFHAWRAMTSGDFGSMSAKVTPTYHAPADYSPPTGLVKQWRFANERAWNQTQPAAKATQERFLIGKEPVFGFTHPITGEKWGIYASGVDVNAADPRWTLTAHKQGWDGNVFGAIWNAIRWLAVGVVDVVGDALNLVKDATCKLISSTVGKIGAVAAGAAAGGPTGGAAAGQGAQVVAAACASGPVTCPPGLMPDFTGKTCVQIPSPPSATSSMLLPLLLLGGAGLALFLLSDKKPKG
jgi:hypothetical protein